MLECLDEVIADCLHYFGVDITTLPGHRAIPLVASLRKFWTVVPNSDPPRWISAVIPVLKEAADEYRENDESQLLDMDAIASFGGEYRKAV